MKWGVRKARESGNNVRLTLHYLRARRKLRELNHESNWFVHDRKARIWEKIADSKHGPGKMVALATGARIHQRVHDAMASDIGDLYMDRRRDKFQKAMNEAFKGTKYDAQAIARRKNLKKAQRSRKKKAIMRKIGVEV
jgi:hypothetical protein